MWKKKRSPTCAELNALNKIRFPEQFGTEQLSSHNARNQTAAANPEIAAAIAARTSEPHCEFFENKDLPTDFVSSESEMESSESEMESSEDDVSGSSENDEGLANQTDLIATKKHSAHQVFVDMPHSINQEAASANNSVTSGSDDTSSKGSEMQPNKTWSSLFANNRAPSEGLQLDFEDNSDEICTIEAKDISHLNESWGPTLIGYVAGRFLGKKAIQQCCDTWAKQCKFSIHETGWLIFRFVKQEDMNMVLEQGPYFIFQRPLLLNIIPPFFRFDSDQITKVPVWVRLPSLPAELWNNRSLGKILSKVGKPMRTDALTASHERLSYARALVEVNIANELKLQVPVKLPDGSIFQQQVNFEFVPNYCHNCKAIGHKETNCKTSKTKHHAAAKPTAAATALPVQPAAAALPIPAAQPLPAPTSTATAAAAKKKKAPAAVTMATTAAAKLPDAAFHAAAANAQATATHVAAARNSQVIKTKKKARATDMNAAVMPPDLAAEITPASTSAANLAISAKCKNKANTTAAPVVTLVGENRYQALSCVQENLEISHDDSEEESSDESDSSDDIHPTNET